MKKIDMHITLILWRENNEKITKSDVGYLNEKTISIRLSGFVGL